MPAQPQTISLTTNVAALSGVGAKTARALHRLGIRCVADLILHLPFRYEHELGERSVGEANELLSPNHNATANFSVRGEIMSVRTHMAGRRPRVEANLFDGSGTVRLTWFNATWVRNRIHPGMSVRIWGTAKRHGDSVQFVNPRFETITPEEDLAAGAAGERLRPVYSAGEELKSGDLERLIEQVLDDALPLIEDHLPEDYRAKRSLPELREAYRMAHRPGNEEEPVVGRRRLAFDELLLLQLGVMLKRVHRRKALRAIPLARTDAIDEHIRARLPFDLTASQNVVIEEIVQDAARDTPMNRLLQGDVGSGKTAVAVYAMLLAVADGHQAALMAPTELLAEQHDATIREMLAGSRVAIELITGSLKGSQRAALDERLASGEIDLVIGTHALISESSRFKSLALAVVDEQHRFGVAQRAALRARSDEPDLAPHMLVMTATPIPRTMSLTVFGDLDISTIHGLPPGRMPIETRIVAEARADEAYGYAAKRLAAGEQAYFVLPVIDESERGLKDVYSHHRMLSDTHLRDFKVGMIHGRMVRDERDQVMRAFRDGEIDALVATTVIEVGVDVPNATMMIIEHAERFGLAQLHQLRGRVGRGSRRSICILIGDPQTDEARQRLDAIGATGDGFKIAERDLEIRGPGELFGTRQAGAAPFRVAKLPEDIHLLELARKDAKEWIEQNPLLESERDALLRRRLLKAHGEFLGLADVG